MCRGKLLCLLLSFVTLCGRADEAILYQKLEWGSAEAFNPLSFYLNGAFDTAQNPTYFNQEHFFSNHGKLWDRVKSPGAAIEANGGMGKFLREEFYGLRSIPNWTLHLMGGGYDFRYLAEWYQARGVPKPFLLAFLTSYLTNIGNEALETTGTKLAATDNIADLYFFDLAGKFLFLNEDVARFFQNTMQMRPWHYQPMLSLNDLRIQNAGLNYVMRPKWFGDDWRPFIHFGLLIMGGVSKRFSPSDSLSVGFGVMPTDPLELQGDFVTGIYWDKDDSLLASLTLNGTTNLAFRVNVYPGVIHISNWDVGLFGGISKSKSVVFGANVSLPIGLGVAF